MQRVDWFRVILDLHSRGYSLYAVSDKTGIPRTTLIGYKDQGAEPKHSDGEALLELWRQAVLPPIPLTAGRRKTVGKPTVLPAENGTARKASGAP